MSLLNREFPSVRDWPAFERLCCDLYRGIWGDPETQMHGRSGQEQKGVDVYGREPGVGWVGVQCKGKGGGYGTKVTVGELKREVGKARDFKPELKKFILATTAPNDVAIQEAARLLTEEHRAVGLFEVHVVGWDTLKQLVAADREVVRVHYQDFAPFDFVDALRSETGPKMAAMADMLRILSVQVGGIATAVQPAGPAPPPGSLQARLKDAADLCNEGESRAALLIVERIRKDAWDTAGAEDRSRILIGAAYCRLAMCEEDQALTGFEEAFATAPGHPGTLATIAFARLLSGNRVAAHGLALEALAADPACELAAILLPQTAPAELPIADVEALVPESFLGVPAALRALAQAASERGDGDLAVRYAERAHSLAPDDWRSGAQLGAKLLAAVADDDAVGLTRMVPAGLAVSFRRGTDLLRGAWDRIRSNGNARRAPEVAANLCAALLLDGKEEEARCVLDEALKVAPTDVALLRRHGWFAAVDCDWPKALASFAKIPDADLTGEDRFVVAKGLLEDGQLDRTGKAVGELRLSEASDPGGRQRAAALALEVELAAGGGVDAVKAALEAEPDSMLVRAAALSASADSAPLRDRLTADCRRIAASSGDPRDRALAADTLDRLGRHSEAADAFASVEVPMHVDTPVLRGRLRALLSADRRTDARRLLDRIDPALRSVQPYLTLALHLLDRTGDLPRAIELLEDAFRAGRDDLWSRLAWIELSERSGETTAAVAWLAAIPADVQGSARELMALAHAIDRVIGDVKAVAIAYRALRAGYDDPKMHVAYSFRLLMFGNAASRLPPQPTAVAVDTAVTLSREGRPDIVRVIEHGEAPSLTRCEVPPADPLAARLIGLRPGDAVDLPVQGGPPEAYRIRLIEGKFWHAHRRTLEDFHRLFPEDQSFRTIQLDMSLGADALAPIVEVARERTDQIQSLEGAYREGRLPIVLFARMAGRHACDVWDVLRVRPDLPLVCAVGTEAERGEAMHALAASTVQVLDPLLVYSAAALGIVPQIRAALPGRAVTQSAIDFLRALAAERRDAVAAGGGTLGWNGQALVLDEPSDASREVALTAAEDALSFALSCRIVAAEGAVPVAEAVGIFEALPDAFADAIRAAQAPAHVLVSDDLSFRLLASACGVPTTAWTQPALRHGLTAGRVDVASFTEANGSLAGTSYRFLSFADLEVVHAVRAQGWIADGHAARFLERLASPGNEAAGVTSIVANVLLAAWEDGESRKAAAALVAAFLAANPVNASAIMDAALAVAAARLRCHLWRNTRKAWALSTSHTPVDGVMARIAAPAARVRNEIAARVREAFAG